MFYKVTSNTKPINTEQLLLGEMHVCVRVRVSAACVHTGVHVCVCVCMSVSVCVCLTHDNFKF